jgi:hypothetical protein
MQDLKTEIEHAIKKILRKYQMVPTVESRVAVEPLQGHPGGLAITANYAALPRAAATD